MRNLKRFLAMALTVLMVVGSFSAMSVSAFEDVTDYQEAIDVMAALGILKGTDEEADLFSPEENIARWQMALIITKMMTGKVDAAYVEANFNTSINSTLYTDLNEGQYMGATAYAANNGIVVGTSATTYEPEAEIMIQDVFTMVVRMLGYGSTAMNANYPWSFIDKAISLGLDAGLPADYANEKAATRGETAQILYNALTAVKADGSTLGYDFFGLEKATVIITGTKDGNMFTDAKAISKTADGVDYVAFNVLNADGSIAATTYYAPKSAFGIEGNANAYVGYPYVVRTVDAFANFMTVEPIEAVVVDQDAVVGAAAASGKGVITIDGTAYTLKETFSDFIADNNAEIILYQTGNYASTIDYGSYVMNEDLDILGKDGKVLLEWHEIGNVNGAAFQNGTYLYKVADGKYIVPNDAIWAQAATYVTGTNKYGFKAILDSYTLETKDAYSDTVLFDLDGDGDYEYGFYTQYAFKKIADDKTIDTAKKASELTFVTADGAAAKYADYAGKYVLYAFNDLYNTVIVKAVYETTNVLVTGVDVAAKKITFNAFGVDFINGLIAGEKYDIGYSKLAGSVVATSEGKYFTETIGKNAVVVIDEAGRMLAIEKYADPANYMVVATDANIGYTTMGYQNVLVYYNVAANKAASTQTMVTVNAMNNYWYSANAWDYQNWAVDNTDNYYEMGDLLVAKKDALGNYDVAIVDEEDGYSYYACYDRNDKCEDGECRNADKGLKCLNTIEISNGIVSGDEDSDLAPFVAKADTVWIIFDGSFKTYTGILGNGTISGFSRVFINGDDLVYIVADEYDENADLVVDIKAYNDNWNWNQASTIAYVDDTSANAYNSNNTLGNNMILYPTYSYKNAIDMNAVAYVNANYTANNNARLYAGNFYEVTNGVVAGVANNQVKVGLLLNADKKTNFSYEIIELGYNTAAVAEFVEEIVEEGFEFNGIAKEKKSVLPTLYWHKSATDVYDGLADALLYADYTSTKQTDAKAIYDTLNDDTADGDNALVVYYTADIDTNKAPIFLAAYNKVVKVTDDTDVIINATATNVTYRIYEGSALTDIERENEVANSNGDNKFELGAGNYVIVVTYPKANTLTAPTATYLDDAMEEAFVEFTKNGTVTFTNITDTLVSKDDDYKVAAYKFTLTSAMANEDDQIVLNLTVGSTEPTTTPADTSINGYAWFNKVENLKVADAIEAAVKFYEYDANGALVELTEENGAYVVNGISKANGKKIVAKVQIGYDFTVKVQNDDDLTAKTLSTSAKESAREGVNYYEFTITQGDTFHPTAAPTMNAVVLYWALAEAE